MNRSDFLAMIPALSAIPFIGKNIVKTDGGIFIEKPVPIKTYNHIPTDFNIHKLEVRIFANNQQVGTASIDAINVTNEQIDVSCRDNGGAYMTMPGPRDIKLECTAYLNFV